MNKNIRKLWQSKIEILGTQFCSFIISSMGKEEGYWVQLLDTIPALCKSLLHNDRQREEVRKIQKHKQNKLKGEQGLKRVSRGRWWWVTSSKNRQQCWMLRTPRGRRQSEKGTWVWGLIPISGILTNKPANDKICRKLRSSFHSLWTRISFLKRHGHLWRSIYDKLRVSQHTVKQY